MNINEITRPDVDKYNLSSSTVHIIDHGVHVLNFLLDHKHNEDLKIEQNWELLVQELTNQEQNDPNLTPDLADQILNEIGAPIGKSVPDVNPPSTHTNILFVGDSLTYKNHMPKLLGYFLGSNYTVDMDAAKATNLDTHLQQDDIQDQLNTKPYQYVVLQDLTTAPLNKDELNSDVTEVENQAIQADPNHPTTLLYQTWAHRAGDADFYNPSITPATTPEEAQAIIDNSFDYASSQNGNLPVVKAGDAFEKAEADLSSTLGVDPLFATGDVRHPNAYGSLLVALMFYKQITGKKAADAPLLNDIASDSTLPDATRNALINTYGNLDPNIVNKLVEIADSF